MKIERIKRTVHYYEIDIAQSIDSSSVGQDLKETILAVKSMVEKKEDDRYRRIDERMIFMQDLKIDEKKNRIRGKLRSVRTEMLPELLNTKTDIARDIEAAEEEGVVETTHFIIFFPKGKKPRIALEYNQFGGKYGHLSDYLSFVGMKRKLVSGSGCELTPIVKNDLAKYKERIRRCSEFTVKVHVDNLDKVKAINTDMFNALDNSKKIFNTDYITLILKFDYRQKTETSEMTSTVMSVIDKLLGNKKNLEAFQDLSVKAEDAEKNLKLEVFDLLIDKVKSEVHVEKKPRYRTVVSVDMYDKIEKEIFKKRLG
jgi:hypothetical protein